MSTLDDDKAAKRRMLIAESLMKQGLTPMQSQEAGGYVIPASPLDAVNKVAQSLSGAYIANKIDKEETEKEAKRNDLLSTIDFSSPDAAKSLIAAGMPKEGVALAVSKAKGMDIKTGTPGMGFIPRGSKPYKEPTTGFTGFMTEEGDLIPSRFSMNEYQAAMTDPSKRGELQAAIDANRVTKMPDPQGHEIVDYNKNLNPAIGGAQTQPLPDQSPEPIVRAIGQVESGNNPAAQSPTSTASGQYQFTDPTRKDAGLEGATPETETAFMNELQKARTERYGGNEDLAILSHNIGITGADEVASGKRPFTAQMQNYINSVRKATSMNRGQSPGERAGQVAAAELPYKAQEAQQKANIELATKRKESEQKQEIVAQKTGDTLESLYPYLYPNGTPVRDNSGSLIKPSEQMVLGNTPSDRVESFMHETVGTESPKAVNTNAFKRGVRKMVLDTLGGSLGTQISDADRSFIVGQIADIEKASNIDDIYSSVAQIENRVKSYKNKAAQPSAQPNVDDLVKMYTQGK